MSAAAAEQAPRLRRTLRAFESYNFRLFWFGQLVSQCGTWMQSVAQAWLVLDIARSPLSLGTLTALQFLPITCGSFFASVLVDRVPKRRLLMFTQSSALAQAAALALLAATGHIQLWHVYLLALLLGCVNALDAPTRQSFVMELVGREALVNAVGLNSAIMNSARLFGPALGGVVIAAWGVAACFAINAVSYLAVLIALALMRLSSPSPRREGAGERVHFFADLSDAVRFVFSHRDLAGLTVMLAGLGVFGFNYSTVIPLFATQGLQLGPEGFGVLSAGVGVGALAAAVTMAGAARPAYRGIVLAGSAFSLLLAAAALAGWFPLALVLVAAFSGAGTLFTMSSNTTLQLRSPDALRGRVMGLYTTLVMGATPLGALCTGLLAKAAGIRVTMLTWAGVCLLAIALGLALSQRRAGIVAAPAS